MYSKRVGPKKVFHVIGLPHAQTNKNFVYCAFNARIINFCKAMMSLGHTVYLYSPENNTAECTEHISVMTEEEQKQTLGVVSLVPLTPYVFWPGCKAAFDLFNQRTIKAIATRSSQKDFLCFIGGYSQKEIADAFPALLAVEYGVGYSGTFCNFRVFDSYAWMHTLYGAQGGKGDASDVDGKYFDCAIGSMYDPDDFDFCANKGDYYLYIGRLTPRKGMQIAADVCKHLGARLIIAGGEGPPPDYGEYVGVVGVKDRNELMRGAKAVFVPTQYIEPFGGVHAEAAMCGTPVITTDWGVFTETVIHGVTGYRCRTIGEYIQAAKNVHRLDPFQIYRYAMDNFAIDRVKWQYEAYFDQMLELWGPGFYSFNDTPYNRYGRLIDTTIPKDDAFKVADLPMVSCWCAAYGRVSCLEEAVESFLKQDYKGPKELVILNDYAGQELHFDHPEVRVINVKEHIVPLGKKFNETIKHCKGKILFCWDDDDIFLPHRISYCVNKLKNGVFHTRNILTENSAGLFEIPAVDMASQWPIAHPTHAYTRELFDSVGGFTESDWVGVDQLFMRKVAEKLGGHYDQEVKPEDIFIVYRFGSTGFYNTSACPIMTDNVSQVTADKLEASVKEGKVPLGKITLKPGWKQDYVKCLKTHLDKLASEKSAKLVMTHIFKEPQFGQDWFDYSSLYSRFVSECPSNGVIVEVGSWKGKSTAYLGVEVINSGKSLQVYAVDTWKGSDEPAHLIDRDCIAGTLYETFLSNMAPINKVREVVKPMRMTSLEGAAKFADKSLDYVFLDASHSYEDVKADILAWLPKIKPGGTLAGHDWSSYWPAVVRAVSEVLKKVDVEGISWIYKVGA